MKNKSFIIYINLSFFVSFIFVTNLKAQISTQYFGRDEAIFDTLYYPVINNLAAYLNHLKIQKYQRELLLGTFDYKIFENDDKNLIRIERKYDFAFKKILSFSLDSNFDIYEYSWSWGYIKEEKIDPTNKEYLNRIKKIRKFDSIHNIIISYVESTPYYNPYIHLFNKTSETGLIAYNRLTNEIIYLSGFMFLHDIKNAFFLNNFTKERVVEYIKIKYYNYEPESISVNEQNDKDEYIIDFFSKVLFKNIQISIFKKHNIFFEEIIKE